MGEDKGRWKDLEHSEPMGEPPPSKQPIAAPSRAPSVSQCNVTTQRGTVQEGEAARVRGSGGTWYLPVRLQYEHRQLLM